MDGIAMVRSKEFWWIVGVVILLGAPAVHPVLAQGQAAQPPISEMLRLKPVQPDVDYDMPEAGAMESCTRHLVNLGYATGWEVRDGAGNVLRRFLDSNSDKTVDQWCYYKDGVEVYRDIDSNFNRKPDQFRWLGTAGIRWGLDTNEDGRIDAWKMISAEEVSEEVVAALRTRDAARFERLLLSADELAALQLGEEQREQLARRLAETKAGFQALSRSQGFVDDTARWVNFGATRPGVVPAGTDGTAQDLVVYENAAAVIESDGLHSQVIIGTLVRVQDGWRVIDLPKSLSDANASVAPEGFFFHASLIRRAEVDVPVAGGLSPEVQQLMSSIEQIDSQLLTSGDPLVTGPLNAQRADVLERLADLASVEEDRKMWIRQLADTVSAAVQMGGFPEGIERMEALVERLQQKGSSNELVGYVKFRSLSADYGKSLHDPSADYAAIQDNWLAQLEQFVADFSGTSDAAEAMLQLAMAEEFAGHDTEATQWYARIAAEYPETPVAAKAGGAKRRIESVGKPLTLEGPDLTGRTVSVQSYRGKVVLIHYWATWCGPCKQDMSLLKDMQAKYGPDNVALIGINLDSDRADMEAFLKENTLSWPQLYEPGGLDSRLANTLGILTLPTMLLLDKEGTVVRRNLFAGEVDGELRKLLR